MGRVVALHALAAVYCLAQPGPFVSTNSLQIGMSADAVSVADVNGDGKKDLVVFDNVTSAIRVMLGNGSGGFSAAPGGAVQVCCFQSFLTPYKSAIVAGDFTGDGTPDVAAWSSSTELYLAGFFGPTVWPGVGNGTFLPPLPTTSPNFGPPERIAAVDANGDGNLDIVSDGAVKAMLGDGVGGFTYPVTTVANTAFGDFNHDGRVDFVKVGSGSIAVYVNDGAGGYTPHGTESKITTLRQAVVIDYDHDGEMDVVAVGIRSGAISSLQIPTIQGWRGDGSGGVEADFDSILPINPFGLAMGDFNGDGVEDWAVTPERHSPGESLRVGLMLLPTANTTPMAYSYPVKGQAYVADLDGDGKADLVTTLGTGGLQILFTGTVLPPQQTIDFPQPGEVSVDAGLFVPQVSASSGQAIQLFSDTSKVCTVTGSAVQPIAKGDCVLTATQQGSESIGPALPVTRMFEVKGRVQTLEVGPIPDSLAANAGSFAVQASASSGLPPRVIRLSPEACSTSGLVVTLIHVGTCSFYVIQEGNDIWATAVTGLMTITISADSPTQVITFLPLADRPLSTESVSLAATTTSGLDLTGISNTSNVCKLTPYLTNRWTLSLVATGTCSLTISQGGNQQFEPASVTRTFTVTEPVGPQVQMITFAIPPDRELEQSPFALVATATSGLSVSFASNTPLVCTVTGAIVTLVTVGQCSITATQAGNETFLAATPVNRSFTVLVTSTGAGPAVLLVQETAGYAVGKWAPAFYGLVKGERFLPNPVVRLRDSLGVERVLEQLYAGDQQINVFVPSGVALGAATVIVTNANGSAEIPLIIAATAPGLFTANATGSGAPAANVLYIKDGQTTAKLAAAGPIMMEAGTETHVVLYGTGIRGHTANGVTVLIGEQTVPWQYAGPQYTYPGLDQINVMIPMTFRGAGVVNLRLIVDGVATNTVTVELQ